MESSANSQYNSLQSIPSEEISGIDVYKNPNATIKERDHAKTNVWSLRAPMLALSTPDPSLAFPPGTVLQPQLFVRNTTRKTVDVNLRFAAAVAAFGQQLRGGKYLGHFGYREIEATYAGLDRIWPNVESSGLKPVSIHLDNTLMNAGKVLAVVVTGNGEDRAVIELVGLVELLVVLLDLAIEVDAVAQDVEERRLVATVERLCERIQVETFVVHRDRCRLDAVCREDLQRAIVRGCLDEDAARHEEGRGIGGDRHAEMAGAGHLAGELHMLGEGHVGQPRAEAVADFLRHEVLHRAELLDEGFDPRDPKQFVARMLKDEALPGMPSKRDWQQNEISTGEMISRLWLAVELLASAFAGAVARLEQVEKPK
jgi:hypothetical protein